MKRYSYMIPLEKRLLRFLPVPGVIAAVTYLVTLSRGVYPGLSAALVAEAVGVVPPSETVHPLFSLITRGIASMDLFALPVRMNLFSALCGTLCAMLLYHLTARFILLAAFEDAGGGGREKLSDSPSGFNLPPEVEAYNQSLLPIAIRCGLVASVLFIFMAPAWSAATRLDKGLFDLLLALAALSLFPLDENPKQVYKFSLSFFLFVLGLYQSAVFLLLLPCYAYFLFKVFLRSSVRSAFLGWLLLGGIIASACAIYAYSQNRVSPLSPSFLEQILSYAKILPYQHYHELRSFFPNVGWLLLLVQVGVPAAILLFGKVIVFKERRLKRVLALLLVTVVAIPGLLSLPISPFFVFQPMGHLPVFAGGLLATVMAVALAGCMVFVKAEKSILKEKHDDALPWVIRALFLAMVLLICAVPFRSYKEVGYRSGLFADEMARAILDQMKGRVWLITNGLLDNHLRIQASLRNQPLMVVAMRSKALPYEQEQLRKLIALSPDFEGQNRQRLLNALSLGTVRFVREWFNSDQKIEKRAMVFALPELWTSCGYVAIPEGLAFGGVRPDEKLEHAKVIDDNRAFMGRVLPLLEKKGAPRSDYVSFMGEMLRMKLGFAANELGVLLEEQGKPEAAFEEYLRAIEIDPNNISAVVNGFTLGSVQKIQPGETQRLNKMLKELTANRKIKVQEITGILQSYGTIRQPLFYQQQAGKWSTKGDRTVATDKIRKAFALTEQTGANALIENASFFVQSGAPVKAEACLQSVLDQDPANQDALVGMSLLMLEQYKIAESKKWIQKALDAGVAKETLLYASITLAIFEKNTKQALELLEEATKSFPTDLRYWTLKADILLGQGDIIQVEKAILPQMQKALKNPDHFLVHAVRGFLLKKKGSAFYVEARNSLLRALSSNFALPDIWNALLELDLLMGNKEFLETDLRLLLHVDPEHVLGNYLKGALLLSRGQNQEAEDFLRRSIEKKPTAAACNDLAENLRRQKKLPEAETFVRRALELEPGLSAALDTLANVLCDKGQFDEAEKYVRKAMELQPKASAFQLTLLRIHAKQDNLAGVREQQAILATLKVAIPPEIQQEMDDMLRKPKK